MGFTIVASLLAPSIPPLLVVGTGLALRFNGRVRDDAGHQPAEGFIPETVRRALAAAGLERTHWSELVAWFPDRKNLEVRVSPPITIIPGQHSVFGESQ